MTKPPTEILVRIATAILELTSEEAENVCVCSDNPEFDGRPNSVIDCQGEWTMWAYKRFEGDSLIECLEGALRFRKDWLKRLGSDNSHG